MMTSGAAAWSDTGRSSASTRARPSTDESQPLGLYLSGQPHSGHGVPRGNRREEEANHRNDDRGELHYSKVVAAADVVLDRLSALFAPIAAEVGDYATTSACPEPGPR